MNYNEVSDVIVPSRGKIKTSMLRYNITVNMISAELRHLPNLSDTGLRKYATGNIVKLTISDDDLFIKFDGVDNLVICIYPAYNIQLRDVVLIMDHQLIVNDPHAYDKFAFDKSQVVECAMRYYKHHQSTFVESVPIILRTRVNIVMCIFCHNSALFPIDDDHVGGVCCHTKYRTCGSCYEQCLEIWEQNGVVKGWECAFCQKQLPRTRTHIGYISSHSSTIGGRLDTNCPTSPGRRDINQKI